jgi:hypothetical protein
MKRLQRLVRSPSLAALTSLSLGGIANAQAPDTCAVACRAEVAAAECRFDAHEARLEQQCGLEPEERG